MEQQPLPFIRNTPDSAWERLYWFFVQAEENQDILTSVKIQQVFLTDTGEMRDLDTVRWYMYRYWRWFLFCVNDRVKPYRYRCEKIKTYPLDYFVQAHMTPSRMQYLAHFVRSIEIDKELRKQATGRGGTRKPPPEETLVQLPLGGGMDDPLQDEILVDEHEEEEDSIQDDPDAELDPPADPETTHLDVQVVAQENGVVLPVILPPSPSNTPDPETLPHSPSRWRWRRMRPFLVAGAIVVACAMVVAVFLYLSKQPR